MTVEERKMTRPDSRWKAELIGLYRSAESLRAEIPDAANVEYQAGIMMACSAIWNRVTGETLTIEQR
jgi:hypothetical protein